MIFSIKSWNKSYSALRIPFCSFKYPLEGRFLISLPQRSYQITSSCEPLSRTSSTMWMQAENSTVITSKNVM